MDSLWVIFWCPAPVISLEGKKEERPALEGAVGHMLDSYWLVVQKDNLNSCLEQPPSSSRAASFLALGAI